MRFAAAILRDNANTFAMVDAIDIGAGSGGTPEVLRLPSFLGGARIVAQTELLSIVPRLYDVKMATPRRFGCCKYR